MRFIILFILFFYFQKVSSQDHSSFHSDYEKHLFGLFLLDEPVSALHLSFVTDKKVSEFSIDRYIKAYEKLLASLQAGKVSSRSTEQFLSRIFYKVHRKVLRSYHQYSTLAETIIDGNYDCLSATTLYALLLNDLGFDVKVMETTYHIYLLVDHEGMRFMFESTDPLNGFIACQKEVELRINDIIHANLPLREGVYHFNTVLDNAVSLTKLVGLHYYNASVNAYNRRNLYEAVALLEKSHVFYSSERIVEFGKLLLYAIERSEELDRDTRISCMQKINFITDVHGQSLAKG